MTRFISVLVFLWANFASAQTLDFPSNATLELEETSGLNSYTMPVGVWENGKLPTEVVEGSMTQQAWRIGTQSLTTLQLMRPLREQLANARFQVVFECETEACGGFDFRFATPSLPPPEMHINLGDYRFLAAWRFVDDGAEYVSLFVSRSDLAGFVQVTRIAPERKVEPPFSGRSGPALRGPGDLGDDLTQLLKTVGHAPLDDLAFETGSSQLGPGPFRSLQDLADYLQEFPDQTVALVGHTDAAGSLDANIALSKRRAASVLERLVSDYGANRGQLEAQGMGYLAPVATNLTPSGREANRRVEVIVTSTEQ